MADIKLTYFDFDGGRGEEARLALHIAGVDFEDDRIQGGTWPERKPHTSYGSAPVLELKGRGQLGQSIAILGFIGRTYGLHPTDLFEAARHEALMCYAEELRERLAPLLKIKDPDERQRVRAEIASDTLQTWGARVEAQIAGPFVAGDTINVADLKLFVLVGWFVRGGVDGVPGDVFKAFPKLMGLFEAVGNHPKVVDWYARRRQVSE